MVIYKKLKLKISKSVTLTSRHPGWVMMVLRKTSDQYLATCKVSTHSINKVKRYRLTKTLTKNLNTKFLIKNFNRKCDADEDAHVNAHDRGDYNSSMHFVQAS